MRNSGISLSSDGIEILLVWVDVRLHLSVYPAHFMISVAHSLLDVAKGGKFSSVGYFTDNTSMTGASLFQIFLRPCLNVLIESVHKICRKNLSKIKLCDWPNKPDATSWQVLNTTESVGMDRF